MIRKTLQAFTVLALLFITLGCAKGSISDETKENIYGYWHRSQNNLSEYVFLNNDGTFQNWILSEWSGIQTSYSDGKFEIDGSDLVIIPNNGTKYANTLVEANSESMVLESNDSKATYTRITYEQLSEAIGQ